MTKIKDTVRYVKVVKFVNMVAFAPLALYAEGHDIVNTTYSNHFAFNAVVRRYVFIRKSKAGAWTAKDLRYVNTKKLDPSVFNANLKNSACMKG